MISYMKLINALEIWRMKLMKARMFKKKLMGLDEAQKKT